MIHTGSYLHMLYPICVFIRFAYYAFEKWFRKSGMKNFHMVNQQRPKIPKIKKNKKKISFSKGTFAKALFKSANWIRHIYLTTNVVLIKAKDPTLALNAICHLELVPAWKSITEYIQVKIHRLLINRLVKKIIKEKHHTNAFNATKHSNDFISSICIIEYIPV